MIGCVRVHICDGDIMPGIRKALRGARLKALRSTLFAAVMIAAGAANAADTAPATDLPDLSAIRAQIYSGEYEKAAAQLLALTKTVRHADLFNLLGYALRNTGRHDEAARWYKEALFFDATHRPALEYQGELFIAIGDFENAEKNLEYLRILCFPKGCDEHDKLKDALVRAGRGPKS